MSTEIQHCEILIIAAGESKRLGEPKQLLQFDGKSLINRLIETVNEAGDFHITLVLGANAAIIEQQLTFTHLDIVYNKDWKEGMASSIRAGLHHIMQHNIDGVMMLVCDQPFIKPSHIDSLLKLQHDTKQPIAACYYANILGTPALFHKSIFNDFLGLEGDTGAKKIINARAAEVAKLHFEMGVIDIDTMDDYYHFIKQKESKNND